MIAVLLLAWNLAQLWRDTNSHAATARGVKAFQKQKYSDAAGSFAMANKIAPTPQRAFNLGTAQIAAGNREQGSSTLARAMENPGLRADALFNRGNSALAANAFDYAIHDYVEALKPCSASPAARVTISRVLLRASSRRIRSSRPAIRSSGATRRTSTRCCGRSSSRSRRSC